MNVRTMDILLRNNTGNQGKSLLINGFVVRLKAFNNILQEIRLSKSDKPEQNYLVIGQRGAGKTTLLYRLKYAIEDDLELHKDIVPIMFNEEQYNLTELTNLWETIAEYLDEMQGFEDISEKMQSLMTGGKFEEERAYDFLEHKLKENGKKIILFIENIDTLLKKIGKDGQQRLREVLTTSRTIRIIGSSTTYFEGIINYTDPFYDFFKIVQLNGLSKDETFKLLMKLAEQSNETEKIGLLLKRSATRVEALRRLTGGNPRMISYLYQIFLDNANGKAIKDLYRLLDDLTFLYKSELDQLSPQQQKVIDVIARAWDAVSVKELSASTRMESKYISSVLNTLEKNQVIETVNTKTKNNLYRLKDRFLNIWYLMRFGRKKDKENIVWLVRFYDAWCDKSELSERVLHHINNLLGGEYDNIAALDMVNTFLSCKNVSAVDKYRLFRTTKSTLPVSLISNLKLSKRDWFDTIKGLVKSKKYDQAIDALSEMGDKGIFYHYFSYWIYLNKGNYNKAAENLEWIFNEKQDPLTAYTLAEILERQLFKVDKAIYFYEIALQKKKYEAATRLGFIYFFNKNDTESAINYHKIAIENGVEESIMALATIYFSENNFQEAKHFCLLAIEKGDYSAYNNLAILLQAEDDVDGAVEVLQKAIQAGNTDALINLGDLYQNLTTESDERAKELYEEAISKNNIEGYYALGKYLLVKEENIEAGIEMLKLGIKNNDPDAAHLLAHHYQDSKQWDKAEKLFIKAFEMGKRTALICLANCAFHDGLEDRKGFILDQFQSRMSPITEPLILIEYCKLLVWNDRIQDSMTTIFDNEHSISIRLEDESEDYKEQLLLCLTSYFIRLIAKRQYNAVKELFSSKIVNYRQILKPVYYAFMRYIKEDYPNEYLKAGSEMDETINEIVEAIEKVRKIGK